eukprot:TRINITY_DN47444_c0_g1_i1.p1 TRINITY_DN47444_c0_g1~~TRINITY_DN47444_c0_g1_i1.p1  ORF type:complete len:398 (+),score=20.36 TRINITY_DN47444_c0_g1_i1:90-1283(+)
MGRKLHAWHRLCSFDIGFRCWVLGVAALDIDPGDPVDATTLLQTRSRLLNGLHVPSLSAAQPRGSSDWALLPFKNALVLSIDPESYEQARGRLAEYEVPAEVVWGYNGSSSVDVDKALALLTKYHHAESLHFTVSNTLACLHTSPGKPPRFGSAFAELLRGLVRVGPQNVTELLDADRHDCVGKVVAIAAGHIRIWEALASRATSALMSYGRSATSIAPLDSSDDPWYLVMEDDSTLCPMWRSRMLKELKVVPPDAAVIKLFFFGHWREEDRIRLNGTNGTSQSPFLRASDPLNGWDLVTSALWEITRGAGWDDVPIAGFYAGTQAYLIRPSGAKALLTSIEGAPFQDIDMTMLMKSRTYVWLEPLAAELSQVEGREASLLQTVPTCNNVPPRDQWR